MSDEQSDLELHRYGLRIPKEIFDVVESIAWDSRVSVNIALAELINESLQRVVMDYSNGHLTVRDVYGAAVDLRYKSLESMKADKDGKDDQAEYTDRVERHKQALIRFSNWIQSTK